MGKLNRPTVAEPYKSLVRRHDTTAMSKLLLPEEAASNPCPATGARSPNTIFSEAHSHPDGTARTRRATVSFILPPGQGGRGHTRETNRAQTHPLPVAPATHTLTAHSPPRRTLRPISKLRTGRDLQHAVQDRYPSILEFLNNPRGDAQASPSNEQDTTDVSPIEKAVKHVQERGRSARAEALLTVGALLKRIFQQKIEKEHVRNVFFTSCTDVFARDPLDNVDEIALAFQLLCVLIQEDVMQGGDITRAVEMLCEEGHHDGCKILVALVLGDSKLKLAEDETNALTNIVSDLNQDLDDGKVKAG